MLSENTLTRSPGVALPVFKTLVAATIVATILYSVFMALDGLGSNLVFHARTFATFVLIGMSWFLAGWRYGSKRDLVWAVLLVVLIGLSLSRMALATAFVLFPLAWVGRLRARDWLRLFLVGMLVSLALYLAVSNFEPLRNRFALDADPASLTGDEATDYTSGRFTYWVLTLNSALDSPWIGHGAGSSADMLSALYETESPLDEPLRILHDYGLIGLTLALYGVWKLLQASWRKWAESQRHKSPLARLHLAAFLAVVAVFLPMLSENSFAYLFMMAPLAVVLGTSLGLRKPVCV
jgi:O-antigen ligase